ATRSTSKKKEPKKMSPWATPKPNGHGPTPNTIDLFCAGVAPDGTKIYAPPLQAMGSRVGCGIGWLIATYPDETLHGAALGSVAAACVYLARDAIRRESARARKSSHRRSGQRYRSGR